MIIGIKNPMVTKIDDKLIFRNDLCNILLDKSMKDKNNKSHPRTEEKLISYEQFLKKSEMEKDFLRISLRAKAYKLIMEGVTKNRKNKNLVDEMEKIFLQNPEKNLSTKSRKKLFT